MNERLYTISGLQAELKKAEKRGIEQERERVIELLEVLKETRPTETAGAWRGYSLERVIQIIKGETND